METLIFFGLVLLGLGILFWILYATAPEGYQDKNGFHLGKSEDYDFGQDNDLDKDSEYQKKILADLSKKEDVIETKF